MACHVINAINWYATLAVTDMACHVPTSVILQHPHLINKSNFL